MSVLLYSAPNENYTDHIKRCMEKFEVVCPVFIPTLKRILGIQDESIIKDALSKMIKFHDIGKLIQKWQENIGTNKPLPSHASIGAGYLWKILPDDIKNPVSFAVAIHHTDKGLLGDNIERPDVQAILEGIVDFNGNIVWEDNLKELDREIFPEGYDKLTVSDLKEMARGLRKWAKGDRIIEQHKKRIQASLCHHILKLCDVSAATERKEYQKDPDKDYYGGWLMVENIKRYVDNLQIRAIAKKIKEKFNPQKIILFGSYAYGTPKRSSDIDLLVIMDTDIPVRKQAALIRYELEDTIPIDIIVRTPQQIEERIEMGDFFIKKILRDGRVL